MLEQIRRNVRHPYIQVLLGLIILVFILFFGWSMRSEKPTWVANVNGSTIDYRAYQQAYQGLLRVYQDAFKGDLTAARIRELGLGRRALDQLVDRTLLTQEADRRGLSVSEQELQSSIESVPVFQDGGTFDKGRYLRVLEANRMTPLEFETSRKVELLLQKVDASIRQETTVTDAEVEQEFRDRNTKIRVDYISTSPTLLEAEVKPTDAQLSEYYDAEGESFRVPEKRSARYILFRPEDYEAAVNVTDQEVRDEYGWRAEEFAVKEAVRARHILLRLEPGATPEEDARVKARAEKLRQEILGGKPFAEVAKKSSEDPGTKDKGGDLGYFERGQMVPEFEAAAFSQDVGAVSEPVKTSFGYHLIQVEDHRQARQKSFEEVKDQITSEIRRRKALEAAYAAADNVLMDLEDGKTDWEALKSKREVKVTGLLAAKDTPPGIEKPAEFVEALFSLDPAKPGVLLETPGGTYLLAAEHVEESKIPALEEVRDQVVSRFRKAEAKRLAEKRAQDFLTAAGAEGWEAAVKKFGLTSQETEPFARKGGAVPPIGWAPELKEAAFKLTEVGAVAPSPEEVNGTFYVIRLAEKTDADLSQLDAEREKIRAELLPAKQEEHFKEYLETLRKKADIRINESLLM
jgi:peptidyl-prolyl cis-trans isomerase D